MTFLMPRCILYFSTDCLKKYESHVTHFVQWRPRQNKSWYDADFRFIKIGLSTRAKIPHVKFIWKYLSFKFHVKFSWISLEKNYSHELHSHFFLYVNTTHIFCHVIFTWRWIHMIFTIKMWISQIAILPVYTYRYTDIEWNRVHIKLKITVGFFFVAVV